MLGKDAFNPVDGGNQHFELVDSRDDIVQFLVVAVQKSFDGQVLVKGLQPRIGSCK